MSPPVHLILLAALAVLVPSQGGEGAKGGMRGVDGTRFAVYLVTFGPGPRVYERFGHNAIWFRDPVTGNGPAYDYGRFSFDQENFLFKFARGEMWYWMGRDDGVALVNAYLRRGRSVWLQEMNLPAAARGELLLGLEADFAADSGRYRYDYYLANCSTRIRDALDRASGGAIRRALEIAGTGTSYRFHTRRSLEHSLLLYWGVMAALGPAVDRPITKWEASFLPMELQRHLREVSVSASESEVPLVEGEVAVAEDDRYAVPTEPGRRPFLVLPAIGVGVGTVLAVLGRWGRNRAIGRRAFVVLAGLWELLAGLAAVLVIWFWALSDHVVAHRNANIFQLNLLALGAFAMLSAFGAGVRGAGRAARILALVTAGVSLLGPLVQWLVGWGQQNAEVVGVALPAHLGVAAGLLLLTSRPGSSEVPPAPR